MDRRRNNVRMRPTPGIRLCLDDVWSFWLLSCRSASHAAPVAQRGIGLKMLLVGPVFDPQLILVHGAAHAVVQQKLDQPSCRERVGPVNPACGVDPDSD